MAVTLSIIIPAYNVAPYLEACVDSVMAGTFRDFSVLRIDDGSGDGTGAISDRLAEKYPALQLFHTENAGVSASRNLGIDHAAGRYIGFVDADDMVAPNMFEELVHYMGPDIDLAAWRCQR